MTKYNITPLDTSEMEGTNGGLGLIPLIFSVAVVYGYFDEKTKL